MKRALLLTCALLAALPLQARQDSAPRGHEFQFSVFGHTSLKSGGEAELQRALAEANQGDPAFVLAIGIKATAEPCSDRLYGERRALLDAAEHPLVLVMAGSDWTGCRNSNGRSNAIERMNRLREVFFADGDSLGAHRIAVSRQSNVPKFRSYAENAHWEQDNILFATLNLPARNNHFLTEAGRNSEYEDRMVANRAWLQRLFSMAQRKQMEAIVLVSDGEIGAHSEPGFLARFSEQRDGFTDTRRLVRSLATKFPGKVLLIDRQKKPKAAPSLTWNGNVGHVSVAADTATIRVMPGSAALFALKGADSEK